MQKRPGRPEANRQSAFASEAPDDMAEIGTISSGIFYIRMLSRISSNLDRENSSQDTISSPELKNE